MKTKSTEDNMAYCNKHHREYPMTLGCPLCNDEYRKSDINTKNS